MFRRNMLLALAANAMALSVTSLASAEEKDLVARIYVIRRSILGDSIMASEIAHSGLLLQTSMGKLWVLELMGDGKVYLTSTDQTIVKEHKKESYAEIKIKGITMDEKKPKEKTMNWTRQLEGAAAPDPKFTPQELKTKMEGLVKEYSVWKAEHCHKAQERLRAALGLKVE